jgi:S-adenosylmethionine-dependent methyltransferase
MTSSTIFDNHMASFAEHQDTPWSKLRYIIAAANIERHIPKKHLQILDAGGGTGVEAISLANIGHNVTLVDYSAEMIKEANNKYKKFIGTGNIDFIQGDLKNVQEIFPKKKYDLILCHNVLQYIENVEEIILALSKVIHEKGYISIICMNKYSEPLRRAIQDENVETAFAALDEKTIDSLVFNTPMKARTAQELFEPIKNAGLSIVGEYGIRCVTDYITNNEIKKDPSFFMNLQKLEMAMSDKYPYYLLARSFQIIAQKI